MKVSTVVLPILTLIISLIIGTTFSFITLSDFYRNILIYSYSFCVILLTIFYGSLKGINLFSDLDSEGIELLIYSKPLSRKQIILGKNLTFILIGLIWSVSTFLSMSLTFGLLANKTDLKVLIPLSFIVPFLVYLFFGSIASLLSFKINSKLALAIPLLLFAPLAIGGNFILPNSNPSNDHTAYFLNTKYNYHNSGTQVDAEKFYLNNNKDEYYLIPNGAENAELTENQIQYINEAFKLSKNSATDWQTYSWTILPFQMIDIFNVNNINTFAGQNKNENNLSKYTYYPDLENVVYSYKTDLNSKLIKLNVGNELVSKYDYLVPGVLKDNNVILPNSNNSGVIYARVNAESFNVSFDEDNFNFAAPTNLVGKITWDKLNPVFSSEEFNKVAKEFYEKLFTEIKSKELAEIKKQLLNSISSIVNDKDSTLNKIEDNKIAIFDKNAVKNLLLENETQRKIYLCVALMYYLYFTYNDSTLLKSLLSNDSIENSFAPSTILINIDEHDYRIGGFSYYEPIQQIQTIDDKPRPITRYELHKDPNNFLFQNVSNVVSISRDKLVVNKYYYLLIWVALSTLFLGLNSILYMRKDYK
ncbi:ABC transporter permease [Mycoplasmopsis felifaucium]|uniref:ABC transporter permease n=1 Tax=Mycoplasmopsis felifaucium TaxID=35768 RepID=A0ABZ2RVN3_9BACT